MPDAVQTQAEDKVLAVIQRANLPWPPASEVRARRSPWHVHGDGTVIVHKGITVYPVSPIFGPGTNEREDVGYGVGVAIIVPADSTTGDNRGRAASALELIRRKIVEDRLELTLAGATYLQTKVSAADINIPREAHRYEASGLVVRCWMREPRT